MSDRSGQTIRDYKLIRKVGEGEFASVYEALHITLGVTRAVKIIHPRHMEQHESMERFKSEAQMIARLNHPHIVRLYEFWIDDDGAYIAMQWMAGGSLESALEEKSQFRLDEVNDILQKIVPALSAVHRQQIVHRDLKPANIMFDDNRNPYVADFGLAKWHIQPSNVSTSNASIGTPRYMPPEQVETGDTDITGAADTYSLGIIVFEMLAGRHPFADTTGIVEMILHQLRDDLPLLLDSVVDIPQSIDDIVQKSTQKDPQDRYSDILELAAAFASAIDPPVANELTTAHLAAVSGVVEPRGDVYAHIYKQAGAVLEKPRRLVGRDQTVEAVLTEITDGERVLLHGLAGMGKTSTAATVASEYLRETGQRVIWIELGKQTADTFFDAIANVLGEQSALAGKTGDQKILAMREMLLQQDDTLLVIDNIWNEQAMMPIMRSVPHEIPVLMTSRKLLSIDGILIEIEQLEADDALDLLQAHAGRIFKESEAAQKLLATLGNHPYAIELAGSRLKIYRHITIEKLIQDIRSRPHDTGQLGGIKKETIDELLNESMAELDPHLRDLLITMGGLYTTYASVALLSEVVQQDEATLLENLAEIGRNGLIRIDETSEGIPFYRMHDLTYSYLYMEFIKIQSRKEIISGTRRYMHKYVEDYDKLELDLMNILGAARTAQRSDDGECLIDIMHQLVVEANFLTVRGPSQPVIKLTDLALNCAIDNNFSDSAHYFATKIGNVHFVLYGQYDLASEYYSLALDFAKKYSDQDRIALTSALVGTARFRAGFSDAEEYYQQATKYAEGTSNPETMAHIYEKRVYYLLSKAVPDYERGMEDAEVIIDLARRHNLSNQLLLSALNNRGVCQLMLKQIDAALKTDFEIYNLAIDFKDQVWAAKSLESIGVSYSAMGDHEAAERYFKQALDLANALNFEKLSKRIIVKAEANNYQLDPQTLD